jgi:hypothetical protein
MIAMRPNPQAETRQSATPRRRSDGAVWATLGALVEASARFCAVAEGEHLEQTEAGDEGGSNEHVSMIGTCALQR